MSGMSLKTRNLLVGGAATLVVVGFASLPLVLHKRQQRLNKHLTMAEGPLTGEQIIRGQYINSGSKDAGRDKDWDWKSGTYQGQLGKDQDMWNPELQALRKAVKEAEKE